MVTPRILPFTITQDVINGKTTTVIFSHATGGTCTYYQWGRKDPFPGATANNQATDNNMDTQPYYYSSITNPGNFIKGTESEPYYNNWFNGNLKDLWNVGISENVSTTSTSKKTIYDPSPVGFKVPPPAAFTAIGLIKENWQSTSGQEGISVPDSDDFWRAFGFRTLRTSFSTNVGTGGHYWSCGPVWNGSQSLGWGLGLYSNSVNPQGNGFRSNACTVRPVSEQ